MKVDEARSVLWPFRDFKGQAIGDLLDEGKIVLKDLGFAAERAYNGRVREASRTLLLHILTHTQQDPRVAVGPLNVITSERRTFAERRQIQFAMLEGIVMGFVLGMLVMIFIYVARQERSSTTSQNFDILTTPQGIVVFIIILVGLFASLALFLWVINRVVDEIDKQLQLYRKGQKGEDRVMNAMFVALDGNWWLFRNLELPGQRQGDIDFVLVGPKGLWAFEVKAYNGQYRTVGEQWERQVGNRWLPTFKNPTRQAKRQAALLSHILHTHHMKQWISPAIVWANPDAGLMIENPAVSIWQLHELGKHLNGIGDQRPLPDDQVNKIVDIFRGLYKQPFLSAESGENQI